MPPCTLSRAPSHQPPHSLTRAHTYTHTHLAAAEMREDTPQAVRELLAEAWHSQQGQRPSMAAVAERLKRALHTLPAPK